MDRAESRHAARPGLGPVARVPEDRFSTAEMCMVLPKGRPAELEYVAAFVEQAKKGGLVKQAIEGAG
jgi:hypothetical protein